VINMSVHHDVDYEGLADTMARDDYEPTGPSWSLFDLAEVRAFELLRREYEAAISQHPDVPSDDPLVRFLRRGRDDADAHLAAARTRAVEAGVPDDFIESVVTRDSLT
jgi:hypothetical protein